MALHEVRYFSEALQKATSMKVIHPDPSVPRPYHCMFLLHGLSDDESIWMRRTSIERYVEGKPLIVVMPDGGRGFYVDALEGYAYLQAIAYELPEKLNHFYKIDGRWCTTGLSMGGYGALRVALEHPGLFVSAVSHSGALGAGRIFPVPNDGTKWEKEFLRVFGTAAPGGKNDLVTLAEKASPRPKIRIDCGTEDFLLEQNRLIVQELKARGVVHEYEEFPGEHNWEYWDTHVQEAIQFHLKNLK